MTTETRPPRALVLAALAIAVLGVGVAAPLIRLAAAPALAVAFWRMALSTGITGGLWAATGSKRERPYGVRDWALASLAGLLLGIHFAAWISSLEHTTVAASVVLVNTQPIFVAVLALVFLGERPRPAQWAGIVLAVAGATLVSLDASADGARGAPLLGNFLALVGAASAAGYYVVGRHLRQTTGLWAYVTRVYGISALALLALAAGTAARLAPFPAGTWAIFVALAIGPSLLGHTLLNWSLRWLPAAAVNVVALGEPIVAGVLAAVIPAIGEVPGGWTFAGGAVTVAGILLVLRCGNQPSAKRSSPAKA